MIIDRVSTALRGEPPDAEVDDAEESLEESSDEMTDGEEPDDLMTLSQGISARDTSNQVTKLIRKHKLSMICLSEMRADETRVNLFCRRLPSSWDWTAILAEGYSGGILVAWQKSLCKVTPIAISRRALHLIISSDHMGNCIISVIYNSSHFHTQCSLWNELSRISPVLVPWLIIGDFNAICNRDEHMGGSYSYYARKARHFVDFIENNNLLDLHFSGPRFIWCNKQSGTARRWARLDRGLINLDWSSKCNSYTLKHLPKIFSDHAPLLLIIRFANSYSRSPFRFNNYWLDYVGCHLAVRRAWEFSPNGNPLHSFTHLLSRSHSNILNWCKTGLTNLDSDIRSIENVISTLELADSLDVESQVHLEEMYARYPSLKRQNTKKWAQRAYLNWVRDMSGTLISDRTGIENAFMNFYSHLWSSSPIDSFSSILNDLPNDLPHLSTLDCDFLISNVSREEADIGDSLFAAINHFFTNSTLPSSWGKTFIALIPKKDNPSSISDYRPISLCNVCLKVISKILANRLKLVLPSLIEREQAGFVSGRYPFDNIIALQEVVHTLENDCKNPPRMLIKIDVEKAYDTISWSAILATLIKMNFPSIWISWIKTCLTSAFFAFLINGSHTPWISSSRGIHQGDPISSYLFILVAQNFTFMLNYVLTNGLIPGFDNRLRINFNHLMFVDDLVIITHASRTAARSIKFCLDFFGRVSGQFPNASKSAIYFPSWINKHMASRIQSILGFSAASFPFKYLGILISPKRMAKATFNVLTDNIKSRCSRWMHSKLSPAGKAVLINSSLFSLPIYYLSVYPIYDSILMEINRIVRRFFWSKSSNGKGIHAVAWNELTIPKPEGGLEIRNLVLAKHSLMAKNIFKYLNDDDYFWVNILHVKYGLFNVWRDPIPAGCSCSVNPEQTSLLHHPWCSEIPFSLKPTYINMSLDLVSLNVADFCNNGPWDFQKLALLFGNCLDDFLPTLAIIDDTNCNHWVLSHNAQKCSISANVYQCLNCSRVGADSWVGWQKLWGLTVAPHVKIFYGFLSRSLVQDKLNVAISFPAGFRFREWLICASNNTYVKAVVVATTWFIWKNRCDRIFWNYSVSSQVIISRAIAHARDFSLVHADQFGWRLLLNNFTMNDGPFLFIASFWSEASEVGGAGLFCVSTNCSGLVAGACPIHAISEAEPNLLAINLALQAMVDTGIMIRHLFITSPAAAKSLSSNHISIRSLQTWILGINLLLNTAGHPCVHVILKLWASPAFKLASFAINLHMLTLFFQGQDLPHWVMLAFRKAGFVF
ncbi:uncharacterized protein LOC120267377 [Dioscorea cayenensis subsp. rotundata]|uniref:Uncharacterized protein LOC120267377 n=1 Tax=Dioscorea cayennensis subsp. rotundata TaxID=55577 RepID=A0AB40BX38_DIOCR|nr:uncharacterized protein LOC120267377 [Dioscorea cayenensis subsp. rotundata]